MTIYSDIRWKEEWLDAPEVLLKSQAFRLKNRLRKKGQRVLSVQTRTLSLPCTAFERRVDEKGLGMGDPLIRSPTTMRKK